MCEEQKERMLHVNHFLNVVQFPVGINNDIGTLYTPIHGRSAHYLKFVLFFHNKMLPFVTRRQGTYFVDMVSFSVATARPLQFVASYLVRKTQRPVCSNRILHVFPAP